MLSPEQRRALHGRLDVVLRRLDEATALADSLETYLGREHAAVAAAAATVEALRAERQAVERILFAPRGGDSEALAAR